MKAKLNLTIEQELIPISKKYARAQGISVSQLVEKLLRQLTEKESPNFSEKWQGKFQTEERQDARYTKLQDRFLK